MLTPANQGGGRRPLPRVINSVVHHTIISWTSGSSESEDVASILLGDLQVNHCHDAHLYLLEPYRFATLVGCSDCTIVVGAVQGMLRVVGCERVQIVSACRRLSISSTLDSVFSVYCASAPVLFGDSRSCQFAPYNTAYHNLWEHLTMASLVSGDPPCRQMNYWNSPLLDMAPQPASLNIGTDSSLLGGPPNINKEDHHQTSTPGLGLSNMTHSEDREFKPPVMLPPHHFFTIVIPQRHQQQSPPQNPFPLPPEYAQALKQRAESLTRIMQNVGTAARSDNRPTTSGVDDEGNTKQGQGDEVNSKSQIDSALRSHFADWLITSGNLRQVLDLVQLDRQDGATR